MQSIGINDEYIKKLNSIMYRFIWNPHAKSGKKVTEKVRREVMNKHYEQGGMNMIDIKKFQDSFLLKWADRLFEHSNNSWKDIPFIYYNKVGGISAFMSDMVSSDFKGLDLIGNKFWTKILSTWLDYKNSEKDKQKTFPNINDPMFNNSLIKFRNNVLFNQKCIALKMTYIKDYFRHDNIIAFRDFNVIYNQNADSQLTYNLIYNALLRFESTFQDQLMRGVQNESPNCFFKNIEVGEICRKVFYEVIKDNTTESVRNDWLIAYHLKEHDPDIWSVASDCCSETKLLELQWKILHGLYPTGTLLRKMKIRNSEQCLFCDGIDNLVHFFVSCHVANDVWTEAEKIISTKCGKKITLTERN